MTKHYLLRTKMTLLIKSPASQCDQKETLILIHGFLCNASIWDPLITQLKGDYQLYTVDLPGHIGDGKRIISIAELAKTIAKELKKNNLTAVHLIGHSLGGYVAGEIIKQQSLPIKSITLINSTLFEDSAEKKEDRDLAIRAVKITPTIFAKNVIEKLFLPKNRLQLNAAIEKIQAQAKLITSETIISYLTAMKNRKESLAFINDTPLHYISSVNDTTVLYDSILEQIKIHNAHLTTLENSGHMSLLEETELVAMSIHSFLTTTPS